MANLKFSLDSKFKKQGLPDSVKLGQLNNLLHDALKATNNIQTCCLIRTSDGEVLAASVGFKVYPEQVSIFMNAFKSSVHTRNNELHYNGIGYKTVRADDCSVYAHTVDGSGLILVKTTDHIIMSCYSSSMHASVAIEATENLGDYLRSKGR